MELTTPPEARAEQAPLLRVMHVRPGFSQTVRVVSQESIYIATHWTTHSVLCPVDDCPLCPLRSSRPRGWCVVALPDVRLYRILEVSGRSLASWFENAMQPQRRLEYPTLEVSVRNSRSGMRFKRLDDTKCPEADPEHKNHSVVRVGFLAACLARIYHLPAPAIADDELAIAELWQEPIRANAAYEARLLCGEA